MIHSYTLFLLKFVLFASITLLSTKLEAQGISPSPIGEKKILISEKERDTTDYSKLNWIEDLNERTEFSATYHADGGYVRVEHNQKPIHRKLNGKWEKIDAAMQSNPNGGWFAPNQEFPVYLGENGSFSLTTTENSTWAFGLQSSLQGINLNFSQSNFENNSFYFASSVAYVFKEVLAMENAVKYNYRIDEMPPFSASELVFSEKIRLPKGLRLEEIKEKRETFWGSRDVSYLLLKNQKGVVQGRIEPAYAVDANNQSEPASYHLHKIGEGEYELQISLSNTWLNAASRAYPVILDPLVVGPTSNWTGGQMPSCIAPQQNIDSILVTIPAGITPIALAVRSSFYADPFTGATMGMGAMQFSTTCNATQLYQIQGTDGNAAGTAFLDSANMLNPLLCCFDQLCTSQQFYLRKHLSRTAPGTGCNATFIRYDPFTTQWPFRAIVYGRTPETYAAEFSVPQLPRCSNNCEFNASTFVRYGVPPYTFTHPWQDTVIVAGSPNGCNTGQTNIQFQLTIPDCPIFCDENYTSLPVPVPTVVDACGVAVASFPSKTLNIKPAPEIIPIADTIFCAGETISYNFANCLGAGEIIWSEGGITGENPFIIETDPNLSGTVVYYFLITSTVDGCDAEPYFQPVYVFPLPVISFEVGSEDTFLGDLIDFQNTTSGLTLEGNDWFWDFGDGNSQVSINAQHLFTDVGSFEVCLSLLGGESCATSFCQIIPIVPNAINIPNVFSPNGDGANDVLNLFFDWAEKVEMTVLNRWGNEVASLEIFDYNSGWNGKLNNDGEDMPDGVYFYKFSITTTVGGTLDGHSFVHLIRE